MKEQLSELRSAPLLDLFNFTISATGFQCRAEQWRELSLPVQAAPMTCSWINGRKWMDVEENVKDRRIKGGEEESQNS